MGREAGWWAVRHNDGAYSQLGGILYSTPDTGNGINTRYILESYSIIQVVESTVESTYMLESMYIHGSVLASMCLVS